MTAKNIISMAASQIGIKEQPANSNSVRIICPSCSYLRAVMLLRQIQQ